MTTAEKLLANTVACGDCLEWQGCMVRNSPNARVSGAKTSSVRRILVELKGRKLSTKEVVLTTCGNPRCINPDHLRVVTRQKMIGEVGKAGKLSTLTRSMKLAMARRKRAKITMEQAQEIRASDKSRSELAEQYGICYSMVRYIQRGESWKEYTNPFMQLMK